MFGVKFEFPYPPSTNTLYVKTKNGGKALNGEHAVFRTRVRLAFFEQAVTQGFDTTPLTGSLCVTLAIYRPRQLGDLDNAMKTLFDSLNGLVWRDDSQIVRIVANRYDDRYRPRCEVTVIAYRTDAV